MYTKKVLALVLAVLLLVALVPTVAFAADFVKPAELADFLPFDDLSAFGMAASTTGGLWSQRTPGAYDPELDKLSIPDIAYVYSTAGKAAPAAIAGYTKVTDIAKIKAGEFAVYEYTSMYGPTGYIILVPAAEKPAEPATPAEPDAPVVAEPPVEEAIDASPTNNALTVDGKAIDVVAAYKIGGENYFKLRDIAFLCNTADIEYDSAEKTITIILAKEYTDDPANPVSKAAPTEKAKATVSKDKVVIAYVDGKTEDADLKAYKINGSNYYRLRDLEEIFDMVVGYDSATKTATITLNKHDVDGAEPPEATPAPEATTKPAEKTPAEILGAIKAGDDLPATVGGKEIKWYENGGLTAPATKAATGVVGEIVGEATVPADWKIPVAVLDGITASHTGIGDCTEFFATFYAGRAFLMFGV